MNNIKWFWSESVTFINEKVADFCVRSISQKQEQIWQILLALSGIFVLQ